MFKLLEPVVLKTDVPERGLRKGLLGTIVEVYSPVKVEVEFLAGNGRTIALLPLSTRALRRPTDTDAIAVAKTAKRKAVVIGPLSPPRGGKRRNSATKSKSTRIGDSQDARRVTRHDHMA